MKFDPAQISSHDERKLSSSSTMAGQNLFLLSLPTATLSACNPFVNMVLVGFTRNV